MSRPGPAKNEARTLAGEMPDVHNSRMNIRTLPEQMLRLCTRALRGQSWL